MRDSIAHERVDELHDECRNAERDTHGGRHMHQINHPTLDPHAPQDKHRKRRDEEARDSRRKGALERGADFAFRNLTGGQRRVRKRRNSCIKYHEDCFDEESKLWLDKLDRVVAWYHLFDRAGLHRCRQRDLGIAVHLGAIQGTGIELQRPHPTLGEINCATAFGRPIHVLVGL